MLQKPRWHALPRCVFCQAHKIAIVATMVTVIMHIPIVTVILLIGENAMGFQSSLPRAVEDYRFRFRFWGDFQTHLASSFVQYACESVHFCNVEIAACLIFSLRFWSVVCSLAMEPSGDFITGFRGCF